MKKQKIDYKKIGLKVGLELHQRLGTRYKLFCNCLNCFPDKPVISEVKRKLHPIISELGEKDIAAQFEYLQGKIMKYQVFPRSTCLVCLDEEPPHPLNQNALKIGIEIALLLNMDIPKEIHIMRKQILDGSSCCSFQRTCIIGQNGFIKFKGKKVRISNVFLEEESCGIVNKEKNIYRLDRQGIPLIEIATGLLEGYKPSEIQGIARKIGMILRSTGHVSRGLGTIRQDVNVSVKGGQRVEIKGVQDLKSMGKVIKKEVERQLNLTKKGKKVSKDVRKALANGKTKFIRPLPGASRLYPETDLPPVKIDKSFVEEIGNNLPETIAEKKQKFGKLNISKELADEISKSDYSELFEKILDKFDIEPRVVANVFVNTLKDLERNEKVDIKKIDEKDFMELFSLLNKKKIAKESIPEILKYKAEHDMKTSNIVRKLGLETFSKEKLKKIVDDVLKKNKGKDKKFIIGIVMSKVRGKASAKDVIELVKEKL